MKRLFLATFAILVAAQSARAVTSVGSINFGVDTKQVVVSTTPASPTQIMAAANFVSHTIVVNPTPFNLYISSINVTLSTNTFTSGTRFFIPANTVFSPDGPQDAYNGPMWAVLGGTSTTGGAAPAQATIGVFRAQ